MTKLKIFFPAVIVVASVLSWLMIERLTQAKVEENDALLRQQEIQLAEITAENQRLSNLLGGTTDPSDAPKARSAELELLRARIDALRHQTNELAQQLAEHRSLMGVQFFSVGDFNLLEHNHETGITFAGGPRAAGKLNDARAITEALHKYANDHEGEFPQNLDQVASYLPKDLRADSSPAANAPLTGTNDFELVYSGWSNDLTNVPLRRIAVIREREPWLTAEGKCARVYGYADG